MWSIVAIPSEWPECGSPLIFFSVLKVAPALGRNFTLDDDRPGAPGVVIISYALWQRRFGSGRTSSVALFSLAANSTPSSAWLPAASNSAPPPMSGSRCGPVTRTNDRAEAPFLAFLGGHLHIFRDIDAAGR